MTEQGSTGTDGVTQGASWRCRGKQKKTRMNTNEHGAIREYTRKLWKQRGKLMEREGSGRWRNGGEPANAGDSPTLSGQGNKGTPRRHERMQGRYPGCESCARELGAGGEGRSGVWERHALKIERAAGEGREAGRGKVGTL